MTNLPYYHVDAFADRPFTGNQAAVMPLENWLDDSVLQAIGEENNFAETAFTCPTPAGKRITNCAGSPLLSKSRSAVTRR
jgi:PhzF family phenazine biosynthesis protein